LSTEKDPFARFAKVFKKAQAKGIKNPNAMVLSSVDALGRPSSRVVLLKGFGDRGFVFYTNFESRKGREILANAQVCLNFFWRELDEQVRIQGPAEQVSDEEADAYFASRPRGSQLGAWASQQSRPTSGRAALAAEVVKVGLRYPLTVPRPPHWSGFRVVPRVLEFWVAGTFRMHDRTLYERNNKDWSTQKLFP
jgi:pyridoxamine 5'-phosphate oxidase